MEPMTYQSAEQVKTRVNAFILSVYNWMFIGLGLTGVVAYSTFRIPALSKLIFSTPGVFFALMIGELAMVFILVGRITKMQASTATAMFVAYSALNGLTMSFIFLAYTKTAIFGAFFATAGTFAACSIYGWVTKRDLTSMGSFMFMGLIGVIIASVVNMFLASSALYWAITYITIFIFVGLTAYDTQKIKEMALTQPADIGAGAVRKGAIMGALKLYLDFINLFLMMLRLFGGGRD
ncbi:MAG: Bax inhibitor-1/YccA family protein [Desulfatibacillum sp.]|nr:Bax inhibitor-1/YccA family protein [Desulfatibacillum sp.]